MILVICQMFVVMRVHDRYHLEDDRHHSADDWDAVRREAHPPIDWPVVRDRWDRTAQAAALPRLRTYDSGLRTKDSGLPDPIHPGRPFHRKQLI